MTTRPYELLARFAATGTIAGVSVRSITTINGRDFEGDPQPLSGAGDPAFTAFASQFSAAAVAERDALVTEKQQLQSQIQSLTSERDTAQAQLATLTDDHNWLMTEYQAMSTQLATITAERDAQAQRIIELEGQLDALLNPVGPDLTTRDGVRQHVSNARYAAETGGIYVGDQFFSTERDEIGHWFPRFYNAMMWLQGDARVRATNPNGMYPYKPKNHPPTLLSAGEVLRAYECIAWYINACFAEEAILYQRLDNEAPLDVIVTASATVWPSNRFSWQPPA